MLRAVFYARCSTEEESQKDALVQQVKEAEVCIKEQGWTLVDRYIESKSGTTTKGRQEYTRLYEDLLKDKFDITVLTTLSLFTSLLYVETNFEFKVTSVVVIDESAPAALCAEFVASSNEVVA